MKKLFFLLLLLLPVLTFAQDFRYTHTQTLVPFANIQGTGSISAHTINSNDDSLQFIMVAPEAVTYTKICYHYGTRTGTPPTYKVGIEGVDLSTGLANGTYDTGTGECSATFTPPADASINGTEVCQTLTGTTCALNRGEVFAVTIKYGSGTVDGSNNSSFGYGQSSAFNNQYNVQNKNNQYSALITNGGAASKQDLVPIISWGTTTRRFGNPYASAGSHGYSSTSTPDEYAVRFIYSCAAGQTFEVSGINVYASTCATTKSLLVSLYSGTTTLNDVVMDCDVMRTLGSTKSFEILFDDATLATLTCGTAYRIGIAPQEASSGFTIWRVTAPSNDALDAWPMGKETYTSSRTDAGAWTDITAERLEVGLIINKVGAVAGGLKGQNNTSGGTQ